MTVLPTPIKSCKYCPSTYPETELVCPSCSCRDCDHCSTKHDSRHIYLIRLYAGYRFLCKSCRSHWLDALEQGLSPEESLVSF